MFEDDELLRLAGIQLVTFCKRQFALAYLEMQWEEKHYFLSNLHNNLKWTINTTYSISEK